MKLTPIDLTLQQRVILANAGYRVAQTVTFTAGRNNIGGVDVVALRNGKYTLIDELTWTMVVSCMIPPPPKPAVKPMSVPWTAPHPPGPCVSCKRKAEPVIERPVDCPPTPEAIAPKRKKLSTSLKGYLQTMRKNQVFGSGAELVAAANAFKADIQVFQDVPGQSKKRVARFLPEDGSKPVVAANLMFDQAGQHYDSLVNGKVVKEKGDGNCMFRALSRAFKKPYQAVRESCCNWIEANDQRTIRKYGGQTMEQITQDASDL